MPRPKLHSDLEVLQAAREVLLREGPASFTLSDVAKAVGISRAALIQRFRDKSTLHHMVMEEMTQEVRDYFDSCPREVGLVPLWSLLKELVAGMGAEVGGESFLLLFWGDIIDPVLRKLALERNELVRTAIEDRLPAGPHAPTQASGLIQSVIQGAYMRWMVSRSGPLESFMLQETRQVLLALYPDHPFEG
jgi:AcrR family transcriptional regulator